MSSAFNNLKLGVSVRWRLVGLMALLLLAFSSSGLNWWQGDNSGAGYSTEGTLQRAKANAFLELRTAFGDYRYWRLAGLVDSADGKSDSLARAKVQLELATQQLKASLARTAKLAPEVALSLGEQVQSLATEIPNGTNQVAELRARLDSLYERISALAEGANQAASAADMASQPGSTEFFALLGLLSLATLLALTLVRSIVGPLEALVEGAQGLAQGALDSALPVHRNDEFGSVAKALDHFRERSRQWDYLAFNDPLTGLANRAKLEVQLSAEVAELQKEERALILLYLGVDQLTTINDTFGPAAGDEFLKIAAKRLRSSIPDSCRVFYVGGSHFAVLAAAIPNDAQLTAAADQLARALVNDMSRPFTLEEQELEMTVKLGIVTCPQDGATADELIANAYGALTHARRTGGSSFQFYTRQITEKARQRITLASQLRRAVPADELRVHYQPVLNVATNEIVAAEALMRWQHPARGLIMPGEFIQVAEESGAINAMGEWCLAKACADSRRWREEGLGQIKLAVNLSARQLSEPGLVDLIQRTLENAKMAPADLELEITESTVMHDPDSSVRVLRHLKSIGIGLSVDDFGTGYSSLTYLQRFPLDKIKIDRSFVSRLSRRRKDELIIAATTGLATDLGLEVVAEGVETHEQLRLLRQLGCHLMQGFLFSRGLPLEDFLKWARSPGAAPQPDITIN